MTKHKSKQTPRYSFLSICFIWQSSNSDSSHSIYSSSSNLLHFNLSSSPRSFYFRTIAPSWRGFHFPIPKCYSWILLSVWATPFLSISNPFSSTGALIPIALVPEVWHLLKWFSPKEVVAGSQLYHLFQVRLAYYTMSRHKNLDTVELISFI